MPGGNNLEGNDPPYYWKWNETIGPLKDRPGYPGTWGYENTNGLGLVEYLQWCEDLEMEPGKHNFFQISLLRISITEVAPLNYLNLTTLSSRHLGWLLPLWACHLQSFFSTLCRRRHE